MPPQFIFTMKDLRQGHPPGQGDPEGHLAVLLPGREDRRPGRERRRQVDAAADHGRRRQGLRRARPFPAEGTRIGYLPQEPRARPGQERARAHRGGGRREARDPGALRGDLRPTSPSDDGRRVRAPPGRRSTPRTCWELDRQLEIAMDALRLPPGDADVTTLSGGETPPRGALPPAAAAARHAAARRADQPPRRRVGRLARALPEGVPGHRRRGHPRPLLPRQRGRLDPRARPRRTASRGRATTRPGSSRRTSACTQEEKESSARQQDAGARARVGAALGPRARQAKGKARIADYEDCWPRSRRPRSATTSARSRSRPGRASATS